MLAVILKCHSLLVLWLYSFSYLSEDVNYMFEIFFCSFHCLYFLWILFFPLAEWLSLSSFFPFLPFPPSLPSFLLLFSSLPSLFLPFLLLPTFSSQSWEPGVDFGSECVTFCDHSLICGDCTIKLLTLG